MNKGIELIGFIPQWFQAKARGNASELRPQYVKLARESGVVMAKLLGLDIPNERTIPLQTLSKVITKKLDALTNGSH